MQARGSGRGAIVPTVTTSLPNFWSAYSKAVGVRAALTHDRSGSLNRSPSLCRSLSRHSQPRSHNLLLRTARQAKFLQPLYPLTAVRMATTSSTEAPEWPAQKVRDTFLKFFEDRGHTFGKNPSTRTPNES